MLKSKKAKIIVALMVAVMLAVSVWAAAESVTMSKNGISYASAGLRVEGSTVTAVTTPHNMGVVSEVRVDVYARKGTSDQHFYGSDESSAEEGWPFGASVVSTNVVDCVYASSDHTAVPLDPDVSECNLSLIYNGTTITIES